MSASTTTTTFYYDGDCGLCTAFTRRVAKFDRRGRVQWIPYQSLNHAPSPGNPVGAPLVGARANTPSPSTEEGWDGGDPPAITLSQMQRAAYTITPKGEIAEGYHAIRALFRAIPTLAPLALLMTIPGASLIGVPLYRLIANNRHRISKTCRLKPKAPT